MAPALWTGSKQWKTNKPLSNQKDAPSPRTQLFDNSSEDQASQRFGFVSRYDPEPKGRLAEWLKGQGLQANQAITFLSDGGDTVRELPIGLYSKSEHLLDWLHATMRLTGMSRLAQGVQAEDYPTLSADLEEMLEHVKWNLWHGKVNRARDRGRTRLRRGRRRRQP